MGAAFKYDPKAANNQCAPDGEYDAQIMEAEETTSKKGDAMIKLTFKVWAQGNELTVFDYIVNPSSIWRLKKLAAAIGMMDRFEAGTLGAEDLKGKYVLVFLKTKKDPAGKYDDTNMVTKYSPPAPSKSTHPDDDLAF